MRSTVSYEWCIEYPDEYGDIHDALRGDKLSEFQKSDLVDGVLVLERSLGNDYEGIVDREWAYVNEGKLPACFSDAFDRPGTKVPARFHAEYAAWSR